MPADPPYAAPRGTAAPVLSAYPDGSGWRLRNAAIREAAGLDEDDYDYDEADPYGDMETEEETEDEE